MAESNDYVIALAVLSCWAGVASTLCKCTGLKMAKTVLFKWISLTHRHACFSFWFLHAAPIDDHNSADYRVSTLKVEKKNIYIYIQIGAHISCVRHWHIKHCNSVETPTIHPNATPLSLSLAVPDDFATQANVRDANRSYYGNRIEPPCKINTLVHRVCLRSVYRR